MNIGYTIFTINDNRADSKQRIRERVNLKEYWSRDEGYRWVKGSNRYQVQALMDTRGIQLTTGWGNPKVGEIGIWFSHVLLWERIIAQPDVDAIIAFEDDAIINDCFHEQLDKLVSELPTDWDVLKLCVPPNQYGDFRVGVVYDEEGLPKTRTYANERRYNFEIGKYNLVRSYSGYCCVANMYSKTGAEKLLNLAVERQIYTPIDCMIFQEAHRAAANLNCYAYRPGFERPVDIDWDIDTTVQKTERWYD